MDAQKKTFIEFYKANNWNISASCKEIDICRQTFYNWLEKDEEFKELFESAKEDTIDFVESQLYQQIKDNNTTATIFFLKTRAKHRGYIERQELTGADGEPMQTGVIILPAKNE